MARLTRRQLKMLQDDYDRRMQKPLPPVVLSPELLKQQNLSKKHMGIKSQVADNKTVENFLAGTKPEIRSLVEQYGFELVHAATAQVASINDVAGMTAACERLHAKASKK